MDNQHDSAEALTLSDDTVLVSLKAVSDAAVAQALQGVYTNLPGDVVRRCERHRIAATNGYLRHMREVRDALAPYGAFRDWCEEQGITYTTLQKALSRRFGEVAPTRGSGMTS